MIILDTSAVVAAANSRDQAHEKCARLFHTLPGPLILPEPLLGEIGYFLGTRCGPALEAAFLRDTVDGLIDVISLTTADRARVADLVETYGNLPLGTSDASVIAVAERLGAVNIATLDHRHFTVVRPRHIPAFTLLP